jgi:hypothetical protein
MIKGAIQRLKQQGIIQEIIDEVLITVFSSSNASVEQLNEMIFSKISGQSKDVKKSPLANKDVKDVPTKNERDEIYINNAGLVILHPFLGQFFEQLQFIQDGEWINEQAQHQAVILLDYLATGYYPSEEFNLPLSKIMCGMHPETVITEDLIIDENIKEACNVLITEIIIHWAALKNTGIKAFRNTFLKRNGKLSAVDNGWLLQVERTGVDVLLGSLPWGIGVIMLPWMNEIIYTEWA